MNHGRSQGQKRVARYSRPLSSEGPSEFLVVSGTPWDKHQKRLNAPWRQNSSCSSNERIVQPTWHQNSSSSMSGRRWQAGLEEQRVAWSTSERMVMVTAEDYSERSADESGHRGLGALHRARRRRSLSKVHLEVLDERRQPYFPAYLTRQRKRTTSWQAEGAG